MKSVVFCDLDGTLVKSNSLIVSPSVIQQVQEFVQQKNVFVICTGRWIYRILPIVQQLNNNHHGNVSYAVSLAGARIYDLNSNQCIFQKAIDNEIGKKLIFLIQKNKLPAFLYCDYSYIIKKPFSFNMRHRWLLSLGSEMLKKQTYQKGNDCRNIYKIIFPFVSSKRANKILELLKPFQKYLKIFVLHFYVEVIPAGISKGEALLFLMNYLHFNENYQSVAIGDSENDLDMLNVAKRHFVVAKNPKKSRLNKYNFPIIDNKNYDAVSKILKSLMLEEQNS